MKRTLWVADLLLLTVAVGLLAAGKPPTAAGLPGDTDMAAGQFFCELPFPAEALGAQGGDGNGRAATHTPAVSRGGLMRRDDAMTCLGDFRVTYYCTGACCNGKWSGQTSTGAPPRPWHTIAVDPSVIPLGSRVYIEGSGTFVAEDVGSAIKGNRVDVLVGGHGETEALGVAHKKVYLVP
ncbi:3D domain-containing protein [Intestinibacillus massiliensis]|uniref:3D domain-containing protein n=1 Tax=Intestinibacillus massiliensis TaxID=1871029 RepID=UPI00190EE697|nr:3D domain-containing protein [Intestinibacillus massiliensis]